VINLSNILLFVLSLVLGKLRGKLNIIIVLHFCYIYDILQADVFCVAFAIPESRPFLPIPNSGIGRVSIT